MIGRKNCPNPRLPVMILPFPHWYPHTPVPTLPSPWSHPNAPVGNPLLHVKILPIPTMLSPCSHPHSPVPMLLSPYSSPHYHPLTPIAILPSSQYSPNPPIWHYHLNETIILFTYSFLLKLEERKKWWDEFQHDRKTSEQKKFKIHINKKENITWIQNSSSK